ALPQKCGAASGPRARHLQRLVLESPAVKRTDSAMTELLDRSHAVEPGKTRRLVRLRNRNRPDCAVQHLVNVSGGKDSTATYLLALEHGRPFRAVFADTGNEHEITYEYVARLAERTGGPEIEVVRGD